LVKCDGKRQYERTGHKWEADIEIRHYEPVGWNELTQRRVLWRVFVKTIMELCFPQNDGNFVDPVSNLKMKRCMKLTLRLIITIIIIIVITVT